MTAKELIDKLEQLDPDTVIVTWREYDNGYYEIKLSDVEQAIQYPLQGNDDQYLLAKDGGVKMVSVF